MIYIYVLIYKIVCILAGLAIIYLGYRLFIKGIFTESGDVEGSWKDTKLVIKKAAPGIYFVLFGSILIALAVLKGYDNEQIKERTRNGKSAILGGENKNDSNLNDSIIIK